MILMTKNHSMISVIENGGTVDGIAASQIQVPGFEPELG